MVVKIACEIILKVLRFEAVKRPNGLGSLLLVITYLY